MRAESELFVLLLKCAFPKPVALRSCLDQILDLSRVITDFLLPPKRPSADERNKELLWIPQRWTGLLL